MTRFRWGMALAGGLVLTLGACSSSDSDELNIDKAETKIDQLSTKAYSKLAKVGAAKCPDSVPLEKSLTFFCTVSIGGASLRIRLKQTDATGNVHIEQADSVIFTAKLVDFITTYASEHDQAGSTVDCGSSDVITGPPGDVVKCDVTFADGSTGVAKVRINDTKGNVGLISIKSRS